MKKLSIFNRSLLVCAAVTLLALGSNNLSAQVKGDFAIGANLSALAYNNSYLDKLYMNYGLGPKVQFNISDPLRLEAALTYFVPKDYVSILDLTINAHYIFVLSDRLNFYPLLGAGTYGIIADYDEVDIDYDVCANVGVGLDLFLSESIILNFEVKYKQYALSLFNKEYYEVKDNGRVNLSVGMSYLF